jgi:hypothetical protein
VGAAAAVGSAAIGFTPTVIVGAIGAIGSATVAVGSATAGCPTTVVAGSATVGIAGNAGTCIGTVELGPVGDTTGITGCGALSLKWWPKKPGKWIPPRPGKPPNPGKPPDPGKPPSPEKPLLPNSGKWTGTCNEGKKDGTSNWPSPTWCGEWAGAPKDWKYIEKEVNAIHKNKERRFKIKNSITCVANKTKAIARQIIFVLFAKIYLKEQNNSLFRISLVDWLENTYAIQTYQIPFYTQNCKQFRTVIELKRIFN